MSVLVSSVEKKCSSSGKRVSVGLKDGKLYQARESDRKNFQKLKGDKW